MDAKYLTGAYSNIERGETDVTLTRVFEIAEVLEVSAYIIMPKPKYGSMINYQLIESYIKLKRIWKSIFHRSVPPEKYISSGHSDISKKAD